MVPIDVAILDRIGICLRWFVVNYIWRFLQVSNITLFSAGDRILSWFHNWHICCFCWEKREIKTIHGKHQNHRWNKLLVWLEMWCNGYRCVTNSVSPVQFCNQKIKFSSQSIYLHRPPFQIRDKRQFAARLCTTDRLNSYCCALNRAWRNQYDSDNHDLHVSDRICQVPRSTIRL